MPPSSNITRFCYKALVGSSFVGSFLYVFKKEDQKEENDQDDIKVEKWDSNWDKCDANSLIRPRKRSEERLKHKLEKLTPSAKRHILMVRHGQYIKDGTLDQNMILTSLGREQALAVGQRLKDLNLNYTKVIRSNMTRAVETSNIVQKFLPNVPLENTDLLNEGSPIPCEPKAGSYLFEYEYFRDGPRIEAAFRKYFHRATASQTCDSFEVMVCHANVIRYFVCRLLQVPPEAWLRFSLHHCSITWATIDPTGNVTIRCFGDAGFLPADKMTRS